MNTTKFALITLVVGAAVMAFAHWYKVDYLFFASYTILQFIVLATAWNILGGYCGYVNFGTAAFFALGAYSSVALHKLGDRAGARAALARYLELDPRAPDRAHVKAILDRPGDST